MIKRKNFKTGKQTYYIHKSKYKDDSRFLMGNRVQKKTWSNIFKVIKDKYVNMIAYVENITESTEKQLELRSEVCNSAGSKINIQKPIVFLYTISE